MTSISDAPNPKSKICSDGPRLRPTILRKSGLLSHRFGSMLVWWVGEEVVVDFVGVVVVHHFHLHRCLGCLCLRCQSCWNHLLGWNWHVELAMKVGDPILLVVLGVEYQDE